MHRITVVTNDNECPFLKYVVKIAIVYVLLPQCIK